MISGKLYKQKWLANGFLLALLGLVTVFLTIAYVSQETFFNYWDYAQYQDMATAKAIYFRDLPVTQWFEAVWSIWKSTYRDYSDYHTLLSIPFILSFGNSRVVYILSLVILYFIPLALLIGKIATQLIPAHPRAVFWSTAYITLFTPAAWLPTLRGYPDVASSLFIAAAVFAYLRDDSLQKKWQFPFIGLCLALAILLRRHFLYSAIAFFTTIVLQSAGEVIGSIQKRDKAIVNKLLARSSRIILLSLATFVLLSILGLPFIVRVVTTNFSELYSSYEQPVSTSIDYYRGYYGWISILLAMLGIAAGVLNHVLNRRVALFIALFFSISVTQWFLNVKQLGFHYSMHFTSWIILGLSALIWTVWRTVEDKKWQSVAVTIFTVYLSFNTFVGLAPADVLTKSGIGPILWNTSLWKLFPTNNPPFQRQDEEALSNLIAYLRSISEATDPIYVAASSEIISSDLLWHVDRALYEDVMSYSAKKFWSSKGLNIQQWVPFADSRDSYPLERLLYSKYVVVATPPQYHLRVEEHDIIRVVVDLFTKNLAIAQDFVQMPEEFLLDEGVTVKVFKRAKETSLDNTLQTLKIMEEYTGTRPGGQLSWLNASSVQGYYLKKNTSQIYNIEFYSNPQLQPISSSFIYLDTQAGTNRITGKIASPNQKCSELSLKFSNVNSKGDVLAQSEQRVTPTEKTDFSIRLSFSESENSYGLLTVSKNSNNPSDSQCIWTINDLSVQKES